MGINTLRAAKTICESLNWRLSNLPLQKLIYLSHMLHLGIYEKPLIDGSFEAWDLGPVEPNLYSKVKAYGNKPIPDIFGVPSFPDDSTEYKAINEVIRQIGDKSPSVLVKITHQPHGAWAKHYQRHMLGVKIPDIDIKSEYDERRKRADSKNSA